MRFGGTVQGCRGQSARGYRPDNGRHGLRSDPDIARYEGQERAAAFCDSLAELSGACDLQPNLRAMDIPEDILPKLASDAMNQTRLLLNNPRPVTEADALAIYRAAY
ncbi:iron-containing alcohol dehydrogenase [uncultured Roseibium sp.]|uniref:iron-containing alcohol dehydrogenase n=1 Tax=uncultured Roseibium sp. TaxID=1936171 RepID=UPI0032174CE8